MTSEMSARAAVTEIFDVAVALQGNRPSKLHVKMKKKTVNK
jgi:hypothetical protein